MLDEIAARFPYWATAALIAVGLYGMVAKRSLVKKLIGLSIFQTAIILFFVAGSQKEGAGIPIIEEARGVVGTATHVVAADLVNPLPHVLMLTAIVVAVAITGAALAFLVRIHREFDTLDEQSLLEQVRR